MEMKNEPQETSHLANFTTNKTISELISTLRSSFRADDFDRAQQILQAKEDNLKQQIKKKTEEINLFQKERDFHRLQKIKHQTEIKALNETAEYYVKLLGNLKNVEEEDYTATIAELTKKNTELESAKNLAEEKLQQLTNSYENRVSKLEEDIKMLNKRLALDCLGSMEVNQRNPEEDNQENSNGESVYGCFNV